MTQDLGHGMASGLRQTRAGDRRGNVPADVELTGAALLALRRDCESVSAGTRQLPLQAVHLNATLARGREQS
jgi:hypothetical protein